MVSSDIADRGFRVDGRGRAEQLAGIGIASASGAVFGELSEAESGNTKVIMAMCSAAYGMLVLGDAFEPVKSTVSMFSKSPLSTCHFHAVSSPTLRRLAPSTSEARSVLLEVEPARLALSNRLPSKRPMYVVLASSATKTIVWIGCVHALRDNDCNIVVI